MPLSAGILNELPSGARVAVIRLRSLGDTVLSTPALALLRQHRPDLKIAVALEPRFHELLQGNPDVDHILGDQLLNVRRFSPDLCLNLHGGSRSLKMTVLSGARFKAGFAHYQFSAAYGIRIPRAQQILGDERPVHTAEHLASAMFHLGVPQTPIPRARLFTTEQPEAGAYAVIHPFASQADKTWPVENFVQTAQHLKRHLGLRTIVLAGPGENPEPFRHLTTVYQSASLATVKGILKHASLFIGNDSGPAHMAAAFGLPVIVLYGSSDHRTWAPWQTPSRIHTNLSTLPVDAVLDSALALQRAAITTSGRQPA